MKYRETRCYVFFEAKCLEGLVTFRFWKGTDSNFINSARRLRVEYLEYPESAISIAQRILNGCAHPLGARKIWHGLDLLLAKGKIRNVKR